MNRQHTHDTVGSDHASETDNSVSVDPSFIRESNSEDRSTVRELERAGFDFYVDRRIPGKEILLKRQEVRR